MPRLYQRNGVWWMDFTQGGKRVRLSTGCTLKTPAQAILAQAIKDAEYAKAGLLPVSPSHARVPLATHVDDWVRSLVAHGARTGTSSHGEKARRCILAAADRMNWRTLPDMTTESIHQYLIGVPGATRTRDAHRRRIRAFLQWCVLAKRMLNNPCSTPAFRGRDDRRRRSLRLEEARRLILCGLIPPERRTLYRVAIGTGLRKSELSTLQVQHVRLDSDSHSLYLPPFLTKSGRAETVPLSDEMSRVFERLIRGRGPQERVFNLPQSAFTSRRFGADMKLAGIERVDHRGHVATFHSLRRTFNSLLASVGISGTIRQRLMRQRNVVLTDETYLDESMLPIAGSVRALPLLVVMTKENTDETCGTEDTSTEALPEVRR